MCFWQNDQFMVIFDDIQGHFQGQNVNFKVKVKKAKI